VRAVLVHYFTDRFKINIFLTCCFTSRTCSPRQIKRSARKRQERGELRRSAFSGRRRTWRTSLAREVNDVRDATRRGSADVAYGSEPVGKDVAGVLAEDSPQVLFTVDEHPVGALARA